MPEFPSLAHVAVTVTDLDRSTQWYTALFGSEPVLDEDEGSGAFHHTVYALPGGQLFGLHTHTRAGQRNVRRAPHRSRPRGLRVQWPQRTAAVGRSPEDLGISHDGIKDATYGSGVSFRDPDGIALEFFAPPGVD